MPIFDQFELLDERLLSRKGSEQMAVDDYLLNLNIPIVRFYRWDSPIYSIGCLQRYEEVVDQAKNSGLDIIRRYTGGGAVLHTKEEFTFSVIVPRGMELAEISISDSYEKIHQCVAEALNQCGIECRLADEKSCSFVGGFCFKKPVTGDVVGSNKPWANKKIVGGAQRRTSLAMLYQGSIVEEFDEFTENFLEVGGLKKVSVLKLDEKAIEARHEDRYSNRGWIERR